MPVYVETTIRASVDEVWRRTQSPEAHARWDLRFTDIEYLPRPSADAPQQFRYATRLGFGLAIEGGGETTVRRDGAVRSSALRFWSHDPRSLIREGTGYWKYIPVDGGVRFLTRYVYRVRFGAIGRLVDRLVFRPLMAWATAWSFDRLRLWLERGIDPASSLRQAAAHVAARVAVALAFIYQGLVPKLLALHSDELSLAADAGLAAHAPLALRLLGGAEIVFGLLLLWPRLGRSVFVAAMLLLLAATADVALFSPRYFAAAFNPAAMNGALLALSFVGWLTCKDLPSARRCRFAPPPPAPRSTAARSARTSTACTP